MNLNATLFIQCLVFFGLAWFTMRFIWPSITKALDERSAKVAQGLADAENARIRLENAEKLSDQQFKDARDKALEIERRAEKQAGDIILDAKQQAEKIISDAEKSAQEQSLLAQQKAKRELMQQFSSLVLDSTRAVLQQEVDLSKHEVLLNNLLKGWSSDVE